MGVGNNGPKSTCSAINQLISETLCVALKVGNYYNWKYGQFYPTKHPKTELSIIVKIKKEVYVFSILPFKLKTSITIYLIVYVIPY